MKKKMKPKKRLQSGRRRPGKSCGSSLLRRWRPGAHGAFSVSPRHPQITLKHTLISVCSETLQLGEDKDKLKNEEKTNTNSRTKKLVLLLERLLDELLNQAYCRKLRYLWFTSLNSINNTLRSVALCMPYVLLCPTEFL